MGTQIVQYLFYGIRLPYEWHEDWERDHTIDGVKPDFYQTFEPYMDGSHKLPRIPGK